MANGNAQAVLQMLANEGLAIDPNEMAGEIDIDQLRAVMSKLEEDAIRLLNGEIVEYSPSLYLYL